MRRAREAGIDVFAMNIGTDSFTDKQLGFAYESAANNEMKLFLSFDFNYWGIGQGNEIGAKLRLDGKVFVSSFVGDGVNVESIRLAVGLDIFFALNFYTDVGDFNIIDGVFNWMAWPSNGDN
ncbi:Glucan endo-1-3-alpha-glucosidase agn1 [Penicillium diatomitis]|uniref:Glucan endo-1-3-alpha-glucosidase agn1 n=1 Tax=Penicillium diatomitis TaxID=2819901 RepID=A0A9W9WT34_9EURO|nr:Glucan endo-1-3-alpha-glucosidase agn1 [Penicillium diatomitis]KAJ5475007.1 Glucan endo-1-3-alpha-glucosidase agn1 [Penicillium diatomitis]